MTPSVLCVPQWQGSGASDARRLEAGARATAALLPEAALSEVDVSEGGSQRREGVNNLDALVANLARARQALRSLPDGPLVVTGGDCGIELAPIGAASLRYGDALTVLWLDAHADLNTPQSSPSGNFHGMVLRTLLGEGPAELLPERPLQPSQVFLAGVRALDSPEADYVRAARLKQVTVADLRVLHGLTGPLYVHIDLDVLDPAAFGGISCPEPSGLAPEALRELMGTLHGLVGVSIVERALREETRVADDAMLRPLLAAFTKDSRPRARPHGGVS